MNKYLSYTIIDNLSHIFRLNILLFLFFNFVENANAAATENETCINEGNDSKSNDYQCTKKLKLQVLSPNWQDQIIYFVMIDRFNDGNFENNNQEANEYDPNNGAKYSGGDIQGVINKIDYIKNLGATAIWITPPVANQWWSHHHQYGGYHGYWATNFKEIDAHFGTLQDYQELSSQLHQQGMYLIQDIVTNHTGNFFGYKSNYDPELTQNNFSLYEKDNLIQTAPTQYPFNLIDRNEKKATEENIYHWTPQINNYNDPVQRLTYQISGLADLNTENKKVRDALKESYGFWIKNVGVDGFRIDTVKFVEHDFWHDFINSEDGILKTASKTGKEHFLNFGEVFQISDEYSNNGEKLAVSYLGNKKKPELGSVLAFPLYATLSRVFAQGRPTSLLAYRLRQLMSIYPNPFLIPTFVDNHDTPRFLRGGSLDALKQALFTLFTIPGIPVIYQGTEQAMIETRAAMFESGFHGAKKQFNQHSDLFQFIREISQLRKNHKLLTRGNLEILLEDKMGAGLIVYERSYQGEKLLVVINSADRAMLLNNLKTDAIFNLGKDLIYSKNIKIQKEFKREDNDILNLVLPARAMLILKLHTNKSHGNKTGNLLVGFKNDYQSLRIKTPKEIYGRVLNHESKLKLVINNEYQSAIDINVDSSGAWKVELPLMNDSHQQNKWVIYDVNNNKSSKVYSYQSLTQPDTHKLEFNDHLNDDRGPSGNYTLLNHKGYSHQADIKKVSIQTIGDELKLTLSMHSLTDIWKSNNGFDNVSFSLFFVLPGKEGKRELPQLNATLPDNLTWSIGHVIHGWGNRLFSSVTEPETGSNKSLAGSTLISVNKSQNEISIVYQGRTMGIDNWNDIQVYITTWDVDGEGNYRPITESGGQWEFGGGNKNEVKILDDILIKITTN